MGIQEDFDKLKSLWPTMSVMAKGVMIGSFLLSLLSIGSIADIVFEFKGFIVTAIVFYHKITAPVVQFFSVYFFNIKIPQSVIDVQVLVTTYWLGLARIDQWWSIKPLWKRIIYIILTVIVIMLTMILGGSVILIINFMSEEYASLAIVFFAISIPIMSLLPSTPLSKFPLLNYSSGATRIMRISAYYLLSLYFLVAVLAAISEGLSRPLA